MSHSCCVAGVTRWCHFNLPDFFPLLFLNLSMYINIHFWNDILILKFVLLELCVKGAVLLEGWRLLFALI